MAKREAQLLGALNRAIRKIQTRLGNDEMKISVGDLVRLVELRNELTEAQPRQVTVRWVDECPTSTSNE